MTTEITQDVKAYIGSSTFGPAVLPKTIASGANLVKGTILGRVTASGRLKAYAPGNSDGSQNPVAVLLEDAAAATADVEAVCGFAGVYVSEAMTGLDAAAIAALEARGLYFK